MTMEKVKRSKFAIFLNTGTTAAPTYNLIGNGVTAQTVNYNPQTEEETYVHQDSGVTDVTSYKPNIPTPQTAIKGDPVFDFVDGLRKKRAVLDEAKSKVCLVYLYDTPVDDEYPAEENECTIQIDDFGGEGGGKVVINYTINLTGDPVEGMFDPTTKTFTAD
ncbi:MAG: hypothetical protein PHW03_07285 [Eubacteriales bacterium]|nr:hypothetical protein [Eubacteriales bacterium]